MKKSVFFLSSSVQVFLCHKKILKKKKDSLFVPNFVFLFAVQRSIGRPC